MEDNEQILVRKQKLAALKESGVQAYPNDFFPSHTTADLHTRFASVSEGTAVESATSDRCQK